MLLLLTRVKSLIIQSTRLLYISENVVVNLVVWAGDQRLRYGLICLARDYVSILGWNAESTGRSPLPPSIRNELHLLKHSLSSTFTTSAGSWFTRPLPIHPSKLLVSSRKGVNLCFLEHLWESDLLGYSRLHWFLSPESSQQKLPLSHISPPLRRSLSFYCANLHYSSISHQLISQRLLSL